MPSAVVAQVTETETAQQVRATRLVNIRGVIGDPWATAMDVLNPTAWWRMSTYATQLNDSSGNAHHLSMNYLVSSTVPSATTGLVPGDTDGAISLAAGSSWYYQDLSAGNTTWPNSGTISVACIIQRSTQPGGTGDGGNPNASQCIIDRTYQQNTTTYGHFSLRILPANSATPGRVQWMFYNTSGTAFFTNSTMDICDGEPHLIVATMNPTTKILKLYVDSSTVNSSTTLTGTARSSVTTMMVSLSGSTYSPISGTPLTNTVLDEPSVWAGTELSSTQIGTLVGAFENIRAEIDTANRIAYTQFGTVGTASETDSAFSIEPLKHYTIQTAWEVDTPQALTVSYPVNGSFANRADLTEEYWAVPTIELTGATVEAGEYTNGVVASLWWEWTAPSGTVPYSVTWSFDWAGHTSSGGAIIRVYEPTTLGTIPPSGDIVSEGSATGASGTASVVLTTPTAGTTYYIQQGIKQKVGTTSHFDMSIAWVAPAAPFTPVIP